MIDTCSIEIRCVILVFDRSIFVGRSALYSVVTKDTADRFLAQTQKNIEQVRDSFETADALIRIEANIQDEWGYFRVRQSSLA